MATQPILHASIGRAQHGAQNPAEFVDVLASHKKNRKPVLLAGLAGAPAGAAYPLKVFICYSHYDEQWRARLNPNLELLQREGLIHLWCDLEIVPGTAWDKRLKRKLKEADVYLFLVSTEPTNFTVCSKCGIADCAPASASEQGTNCSGHRSPMLLGRIFRRHSSSTDRCSSTQRLV